MIAPSGIYLYKLCDAVSQGRPIRILETGCLRNPDPSSLITDGWSTFYFAEWVKAHPGSAFDTVELDPKNVEICRNFLKEHDLDKYATVWQSDSLEFLNTWEPPVDVFFLDSCDGLEHGLEEFKLALYFRPCTIIMDDYESKVKLADEYARSIGITSQRMDRYTVFQVPQIPR